MDNGRVQANFCKKEQNSWAIVNLELTKLQLTVVRKECNADSQKEMINPSPALDWPFCAPSGIETHITNDQLVIKDEKGLVDKFVMSEPAMFISKTQLQPDMIAQEEDLEFTQFSSFRSCVTQSGWDPAGGLDYMVWDPVSLYFRYSFMRCQFI